MSPNKLFFPLPCLLLWLYCITILTFFYDTNMIKNWNCLVTIHIPTKESRRGGGGGGGWGARSKTCSYRTYRKMFLWARKLKKNKEIEETCITKFNTLNLSLFANLKFWNSIWIWKSETQFKITNHTHVKLGHTSEFLSGICWWAWKTNNY